VRVNISVRQRALAEPATSPAAVEPGCVADPGGATGVDEQTLASTCWRLHDRAVHGIEQARTGRSAR
jgi:hypothetical protein